MCEQWRFCWEYTFTQTLSSMCFLHVKKCWNLMNWLKYSLVTKQIFTNRIHAKFVNRTIRNDDILLFQTGCSRLEYETKDQSPGFWIHIDWTNGYNNLLTSMWVCNFKLGKKKTVFRAYNKPADEKTDFTGVWNLVSKPHSGKRLQTVSVQQSSLRVWKTSNTSWSVCD